MLKDTTPTAITLKGQPATDERVAAVYRCRLQLDQLTATDDPDIKFCEQCKQKVFKVVDFDGFDKAVAAKGCVWGPVHRRDSPELASGGYFLGAAGVTYECAPGPLTWDN